MNNDERIRQAEVVLMPNYRVSLAEKLFRRLTIQYIPLPVTKLLVMVT